MTQSVTTTEDATSRDDVVESYARVVDFGAYDRSPSGLFGKYDNVRCRWEDHMNRATLSQFMGSLVQRKRCSLTRLRVLDLGCGSGEGYEILTSLRRTPHTLDAVEQSVLSSEMIGYYRGVDISPEMVEKASELNGSNTKLRFEVADLNDGLPVTAEDEPYDVYFSSYGSLSHLSDASVRRVLEQVCDHMGETAIVVADLLGRFSYEWQCYWDGPGTDQTNMRRYSMSYVYPPDMIDQIEAESFPMRYWGGAEFDEFMQGITAAKQVKIVRERLQDRSILVGRHMDSLEYNPHATGIRSAVNSLLEFNHRTDLNDLIFDYFPQPGHPELNRFFESFQSAWNAVVYACMEAVNYWQEPEKLVDDLVEDYPPVVQDAVRTIRCVVRDVIELFRMDDPLANIVEPQLAYLLRDLEWRLQQGLGAAHGLLAVYELRKE